MLSFKNKKIVFEFRRCCQCGTCLAACEEGALLAVKQKNGTCNILINADSCISCGQCVAVCPAPILPENPLTEKDWESCKSMWIGYSTDPVVRFDSSSGGCARSLVSSALESGLCDKVYCVVKSPDFPWGVGHYLSCEDNIYSSLANSLYLPILVNQNLHNHEKDKTLVVVGTNCQLIAAERYFRRRRIKLIKIAIFCKQQKTLGFTNFILNRLKVGRGQLIYRGKGWPGLVSGSASTLAWEDAAGLPFGKRLWCIAGCGFCGNPMGMNADLTLADPWGILTAEEAGSGKNLIIVHTEMGEKLLQTASNALNLDPVLVADTKISVDWPGIKLQQRKILWRLDQVRNPWQRFIYSTGELQRRFYEFFLERFTPRRLFLRIMNRFPYLG